MLRNKSALKRKRQNVVLRERNRILKSKVHTAKKHLEESIAAKKREDVETCLRTFMSEVDKAVKKNVFHKNKGARLKSRIVKRIKDVFNEHKAAS
jgi:small subunit ribosomal protein S20